MKFYNVCIPEESEGDIFYPRIPSYRAKNEDAIIPRICVSSTLSGCVSAVVWGGIGFENMFIDLGINSKGYPIKVYEFDSSDIKDGNLICPEELYKEDLVRDAEINQEYWVINQELKPRKIYYISVKDFIEEVFDDISYKSLQEIDKLDSLNKEYNYDDYIEGCFSRITIGNLEYIDEKDIYVNDIFEISLSEFKEIDNEEELIDAVEEVFNNMLVLNNSLHSIYIKNDKVIIETNEVCSIILKDAIEFINKEIKYNLDVAN